MINNTIYSLKLLIMTELENRLLTGQAFPRNITQLPGYINDVNSKSEIYPIPAGQVLYVKPNNSPGKIITHRHTECKRRNNYFRRAREKR